MLQQGNGSVARPRSRYHRFPFFNFQDLLIVSPPSKVDFIPEQKGFVRGLLDKCGWVIQPFGTEEEESFCTYVLCLDPKGWVPAWAVNMFRYVFPPPKAIATH